MSFPEEPLDLPPSEGGGYYPAAIHQKLKADKYEIVRKLGYGPRSSTWLVLRQHDAVYFAVKIFTIAVSARAKSVELPILKTVANINFTLQLPFFHGSFWEESGGGSHLCIVMNPLSTSVQALQLEAESHRLPIHVVQKVVGTVADALEGLHGANIMHGAVKAENILFSTAAQSEYLKPVLDSEPAPTTMKIKKYLAVRSQPLTHIWTWKDKKRKVADWPISLDNFGHAQRWTYKPEKNSDYLFAPETLLQNATCSPQTDIWMLGYMASRSQSIRFETFLIGRCLKTFNLLTGGSPFYPKGNISKQIAIMRAVLEDEVPAEWLSDSKMKGYNATAHGTVTSIEASLSDALHEDDVAAAADFIKGCLRLDPKKRLTATEASDHEWLATAHACSCGFCG